VSRRVVARRQVTQRQCAACSVRVAQRACVSARAVQRAVLCSAKVMPRSVRVGEGRCVGALCGTRYVCGGVRRRNRRGREEKSRSTSLRVWAL